MREQGRRIKRARRAAKLNMSQLARRVGVTRAAVRQWEMGQSGITIPKLRKVARATKTTVADLLGAA